MGGIPCRLFLPVGDQTVAGVRDLLRRFSHFLSRLIWKKVNWSSNEGHGPLEVRYPEAFFCFPCPGWGISRKGLQRSQSGSGSAGCIQFAAPNDGYAAMS